MARDRLRMPPSDISGPLGDYLLEIYRALNNIPNASYFSGTSPNSVLTGLPGDLAVNVGSASTSSRLWIMGGSSAVPSKSGWVTVRIA